VLESWTPAIIATVVLVVFLYGFSKTAMPVAGVLAGPLLACSAGCAHRVRIHHAAARGG